MKLTNRKKQLLKEILEEMAIKAFGVLMVLLGVYLAWNALGYLPLWHQYSNDLLAAVGITWAYIGPFVGAAIAIAGVACVIVPYERFKSDDHQDKN